MESEEKNETSSETNKSFNVYREKLKQFLNYSYAFQEAQNKLVFLDGSLKALEEIYGYDREKTIKEITEEVRKMQGDK